MKLPDHIREYFRQQGKIGVAKRVAGQTPEERSAIARHAARQRWAKYRKQEEAIHGQVVICPAGGRRATSPGVSEAGARR